MEDVTTLTDRPKTALLVIDVQNDVMAGEHNRDGVIANVVALVAKARAAKDHTAPGRRAGTVTTEAVDFS